MAGVTTRRRTDGYEIDSDLARMDIDRIHQWLSTDAPWATGRARETVADAARHSLNFGVFTSDGSQVAYARVVTDHATFAWTSQLVIVSGTTRHPWWLRVACASAATTSVRSPVLLMTTRCSMVSGPNGRSALDRPIRVDVPPHSTMPPAVMAARRARRAPVG